MRNLIQTDVLVIGGGGAGCRAAIAACSNNSRVSLVLKGKLGSSGSTASGVTEIAGFNALYNVNDSSDNEDQWLQDILKAGSGMCDKKLAQILVSEAKDALRFLEMGGLKFEKDNDGYLKIRGCFSSKPRTFIIKGHGKPILKALRLKINKLPIQVIEEVMITRLFIKDNRCIGAIGFDLNGNSYVFKTKAVILATGGAGQLFKYNLNPKDITGDGYALGLKAGADLINMEFMQAGLGSIYPITNIINQWLWAAYPILVNNQGEQILKHYLPLNVNPNECMDVKSYYYPFSSSNIGRFIEISIKKELNKDLNKVFLDLRNISEQNPSQTKNREFNKMWPITYDWFLSRGVTLDDTPLELTCFAHALNGGLKIDENATSTITGLYAAGEVAGGPHGADRLGGNMMVTCQVFGKRAGCFASNYAKRTIFDKINNVEISKEEERIERLVKTKDGLEPNTVRGKLQKTMWKNVLVVRTEKSLLQCLEDLELLENDLKYISIQKKESIFEAFELYNLLLVGKVITQTALKRKESRGSHYRDDFPPVEKKHINEIHNVIKVKQLQENHIEYDYISI